MVLFKYYVSPTFRDSRTEVKQWRVHASAGSDGQYVSEIDVLLGEPPSDDEDDTRRFVPVRVSRRAEDWGWRLSGAGIDLISYDTSGYDGLALGRYMARFAGAAIEGQSDALLNYDTEDEVPLS